MRQKLAMLDHSILLIGLLIAGCRQTAVSSANSVRKLIFCIPTMNMAGWLHMIPTATIQRSTGGSLSSTGSWPKTLSSSLEDPIDATIARLTMP